MYFVSLPLSSFQRYYRTHKLIICPLNAVFLRTFFLIAYIFPFFDSGWFKRDAAFLILHNEFEYLLAVLNSSLINWFFAKSSTNSNVNGYEVDNLPIKPASNVHKIEIVSLVNRILSGEVSLNSGMEEIDKLIFSIYDLTSDDIELVCKNQ